MSEYIVRLEEAYEIADFEKMTKEELANMAILLMNMLDNQPDLRREIFKLKKLTTDNIKTCVWDYEKATMEANRYSTSHGDQTRGTGRPRQGSDRKFEGSCFRCDIKGHMKSSCTVKNLRCKECDSTGKHNTNSADCPKSDKGKAQAEKREKFRRQGGGGKGRGRDNARGTRVEGDDVSDDGDYVDEDGPNEMSGSGRVRVTREYSRATRPSPEIQCDIGCEYRPRNKEYRIDFSRPCLADTGSTRALISKFLADKYGIEVTGQDEEYDLTNANGGRMEVTGRAELWIAPSANRGTDRTKVSALVTPDLGKEEIYLSETDLKNMKIIPECFPFCNAADFAACERARASKGQVADPEMEALCDEYKDIFAETLTGRRPISAGGVARITIKEGAKPVCASVARRPPRALAEQAEKLLDELVKGGIIEEVTHVTDWCAHAVFVQKPDGRARIVADYSPINKFVVRPIHGFKSVEQLRNEVAHNTRYMIVGDLCHGYLQVELQEEDRDYTCFLVATSQGTKRFRYTRSPMGLNCSSDHFCRKSDAALEGIRVAKLVDDVLVQGINKEAAMEIWKQVMTRARAHGLTFSRSKMRYGPKVKFGGFVVDASGGLVEIKPDPELLEAIRAFPLPANITELRSFLGLSQQISAWCPDLKQSTTLCRKLLRSGINFCFTPEMKEEFELCKAKMTTPTNISPFDPDLECILLTDASKIYGLGFLLLQKKANGEGFQIVQAGSLSITPTQQRYAVVELEALGIVCGIKKCHYWLSGLDHFRVLTDHKPLVGLWMKPLSEFTNMRLLSFVEKLMCYNFSVEYFAGKQNMAADCLSRTPVGWAQSAATEDPAEVPAGANKTRKAFCKYSNQYARSDPALKQIFKDAEADPEYQQLVEAIRKGRALKDMDMFHPARTYAKWYDDLSTIDDRDRTLLVYNDSRLVIPVASRGRILKALHLGHAGITKTVAAATRYYLWPFMHNEIAQTIKECIVCIERGDRQPNEPMLKDREEIKEPMYCVGMDHCVYERQNYLVMVDEFSSFPLITKVRSTDTADLIKHAEAWFLDLGFPKIIKSDGGPAFTSKAWDDYCVSRNIDNRVSSAANPESNGLAESGVARTKGTIKKAKAAREDPGTAVAEFRNLPLAIGGVSPHELFYKRLPRGRLPHLDMAYDEEEATKKRKTARESYLNNDTNRKPSREFEIGEKIWLYNRVSHMWDLPGRILEKRESGRSYFVKIITTGAEYLRNRKFLKVRSQRFRGDADYDGAGQPEGPQERRPSNAGQPESENAGQPEQPSALRRSSRVKERTQDVNDRPDAAAARDQRVRVV